MQSRILVVVAVVVGLLVCWLVLRSAGSEPESPAASAQPSTGSVVPLTPEGGPALPGEVGKQILRDPGPLPFRDGAPAPARDQ